ncbi:hypothetical protein [Amnibacterium endophyticum]|uniref:AbiEi antitoxin C-terminal domain-containing protein n=1 Tax=Amnibacterium endophyticum TaxID=2109337 RepID=A0ABW4L932_9MICO
MDPWSIELIVTATGRIDDAERRAVSRDVERGLLHRVRRGVQVDAAEWEGATGPDGERARHVVAMRALAEVAPRPPVFSHWSAAVLHGLPTVGRRLDRVHVLVQDDRLRGVQGTCARVLPVQPGEVVRMGGLLATGSARTAIDLADAGPIVGGIMAADALLAAGLPRALLEQAVDLAGPRKGRRRIDDAVAFAHPGAESAAESQNRWSMHLLGLAPQQLQHRVLDRGRLVAVVDTWDEESDVACEVDGDVKYLDPVMAPAGAGRAVIAEKQREDLLRSCVAGLARYGYAVAADPVRLRPVLARAGLHPARVRPALADWAREARAARPRRPR